jgi:sec-independent protein translocase protein TatA
LKSLDSLTPSAKKSKSVEVTERCVIIFSISYEGGNHMWKPGVWELVIILIIVLLVFGVGRLSKLGKDLGEGIREFQKGLKGDEEGDTGDSQGDAPGEA